MQININKKQKQKNCDEMSCSFCHNHNVAKTAKGKTLTTNGLTPEVAKAHGRYWMTPAVHHRSDQHQRHRHSWRQRHLAQLSNLQVVLCHQR